MVQMMKVSQSLAKIMFCFGFFFVFFLFLFFVCLFVCLFFFSFLMDLEDPCSDRKFSGVLISDLGGPIAPIGGKGSVVPWTDGKVSRDSTMYDRCSSFFWKDAECSSFPEVDVKEPSVPWSGKECSRGPCLHVTIVRVPVVL